MNGIPKYLNTKDDVLNLQSMALNKLIDVYEWKEYLKTLQQPAIFRLPVLQEGEGWFTIPFTERELPSEYEVIEIVKPQKNEYNMGMDEEYIKIKGKNETGCVELNGGYLEAERLGLTQEEISRMLYSL